MNEIKITIKPKSDSDYKLIATIETPFGVCHSDGDSIGDILLRIKDGIMLIASRAMFK